MIGANRDTLQGKKEKPKAASPKENNLLHCMGVAEVAGPGRMQMEPRHSTLNLAVHNSGRKSGE